MSEHITVVKLLSSNGKALTEFLDSLSLFVCRPKGLFSSINAEIYFFVLSDYRPQQ